MLFLVLAPYTYHRESSPAGFMTWKLEECEAGTKLRFEHSVFGKASKQTRDSLDEGWQMLFGRCLKHYAETGEGPSYDDR